MSMDDGNVNLLWTGGWDSTFQLLRLLVVRERCVTPFYLIDEDRRSTGTEIHTMRRIRNRLAREYPHTQRLLRPTRYSGVSAIAPDRGIQEAFQAIGRDRYLGSQYDWLSRFCKQTGLVNMQLCIHRGGRVRHALRNLVSEDREGSLKVFRVDPEFDKTDEYVLFRYFTFPIFDITKVQMATIADEQGWKEVMALTWFCHSPTRGGRACGRCNPCIYAIEEGLAWRIPVGSRISASLHRACIDPVKSIARRILDNGR